ncbi:sporulation-delaying protein SdpB family protein [Chitinophaga rhizophila]|uniref:HTTM-like domain-containing protein n=1 Tax=Chitinophaga rhizophila TaxID=2866212 RepID=A0ABS7GFB7_9BACT|nr:sporulation-delaying protein SdpB family protein [Chitinophaga rhizophila]MBW8686393.1 hypothetical protein [Chitinophaga rhizophila]
MFNMFLQSIDKVAARLAATSVHTNTLGLARSIIAASLLLTLLFNTPETLFRPAGVANEILSQTDTLYFNKINFFNLLPFAWFNWLRAVAIIVLIVVIAGWRPKYTCILHAWIAISFTNAAIIIEGGDQIAANLSLLLVPICLTDNRSSHWDTTPAEGTFRKEKNLVATFFYWLIRLQVALIYFHAAIGKMPMAEWANGTAVYYWFNDPVFGMTPLIRTVLDPVLKNAVGVVLITWGVLLLEILLFMTLVMSKKHWKPFLVAGIFFHLSIIVVHGLFSFFLSMAGALILLVGRVDTNFTPWRLSWRKAVAYKFKFTSQRPAENPSVPALSYPPAPNGTAHQEYASHLPEN